MVSCFNFRIPFFSCIVHFFQRYFTVFKLASVPHEFSKWIEYLSTEFSFVSGLGFYLLSSFDLHYICTMHFLFLSLSLALSPFHDCHWDAKVLCSTPIDLFTITIAVIRAITIAVCYTFTRKVSDILAFFLLLLMPLNSIFRNSYGLYLVSLPRWRTKNMSVSSNCACG